MKSITCILLTVLALSAISAAEELPEAPSRIASSSSHLVVRAVIAVVAPKAMEAKVIDKKFLSLAAISTGSTFADSYTTLFARQKLACGQDRSMQCRSAIHLLVRNPSDGGSRLCRRIGEKRHGRGGGLLSAQAWPQQIVESATARECDHESPGCRPKLGDVQLIWAVLVRGSPTRVKSRSQSSAT